MTFESGAVSSGVALEERAPSCEAGEPKLAGRSLLLSPLLDRISGIAVVLPFVWIFYNELRHSRPSLAGIASFIPGLIFIVTMCTRRPAVRVSSTPWYWAMSLVAGYWTIVPFVFSQPGARLMPGWVASSLSCLSILLSTYARLSLGRNIGLVPAQRQIVSGGAYRMVRHPIYTAVFVAWFAVLAQSYSFWNLWLVGLGLGIYIIKTLIEEEFLSHDLAYRAYMGRVRYRWIPGLV